LRQGGQRADRQILPVRLLLAAGGSTAGPTC